MVAPDIAHTTMSASVPETVLQAETRPGRAFHRACAMRIHTTIGAGSRGQRGFDGTPAGSFCGLFASAERHVSAQAGIHGCKACWLRGEYALAEQCYLKSVHINEALYERAPCVAALLNELGELCLQQGKTEEAKRYQHEAEAILALHLKPNQEHTKSDVHDELPLELK